MTDITEFSDEQLSEELLQRRGLRYSDLQKFDKQTLLHDLQVHQIVLEMQNRELLDSQLEIEQARDRYSDLFDFSPVGYASFDQHGSVQEINLTACQMLGKERLHIIGDPFTAYMSKQSQPLFFNHLAEVFRSAQTDEGKLRTEIQLCSSDQSPIYVRLESIAFVDQLSGTTSCRSAIIDISDSMRVRQALREQRDFAENIIETATSIMLVLNPEGKIMRVNSFFEKLTGYTRAEILGRDWFDTFIPVNDRQMIRDKFSKARNGVRTEGYINTILTKTGDEKVIEWYDTEQRDSEGRLIGLLGIGLDLTARVEAEQARSESQERVHLLIDALPVVIAYVDVQQQVRFHNHHCSTWLSKSSAEIKNKSVKQVFGEAAYEVLLPVIETVLDGEQVSASFELPLSPQNKRFVMASLIPEFNRNAGVQGFFVLLNDITEYRREEIDVKQRLSSLAHQSRVNMMGEMASEIAHELNQPLAAISNYADACLRLQKQGKLEDHNISEVLNDIKGQAHRANQIIRHVRDFTQKRELQLQMVDVNDLIKDVLQLIAGEMNWHSVTVEKSLAESSPIVIADSVLLKQVFLNLLNNAVEVLTASQQQDRKIAIITEITEQQVIIEVSDNGPGIGDDLMHVIFKPFFTTKNDGMGLGLSMCQSIIESHGGKLVAKNNSTGGASFRVFLPVTPVE